MKSITILLVFAALLAFSQAKTRTGKLAYSYASTDEFRNDRDGERDKVVTINYGTTFSIEPQFGAAIYSFDLNYGKAGVVVEVVDIQESYAKVRIVAPDGARVNKLGIAWIVTDEDDVTIEYVDQSSARSAENENAMAEQVFVAIGVIAGFQFQAYPNPMLFVDVEVHGAGSEMVTETSSSYNSDNEPNIISILTITFPEDFAYKFEFQSEYHGELYDNDGSVRHQYDTDIIFEDDNYRVFNAISGFSFLGYRGLRLTQTATLTDIGPETRVRYDFETSLTSRLHQTSGSLLAIEI
jgi:hypothetical protein